jgi:hypothetical protein
VDEEGSVKEVMVAVVLVFGAFFIVSVIRNSLGMDQTRYACSNFSVASLILSLSMMMMSLASTTHHHFCHAIRIPHRPPIPRPLVFGLVPAEVRYQ